MEQSTTALVQPFEKRCALYHKCQLRLAINLTMKAANLKYSSFHIQKIDKQPKNHFVFKKELDETSTTSLYPILYQRQKIAYLSLMHQEPVLFTEKQQINKVISKIALLIKRFQTSELSKRYLQEDLALTGLSEQALKIESFIEKAASANCPVIIEGEFGCEKLSVASAVHYNSQIKHQSFMEINCSTLSFQEFKDKLMRSVELVSGGSLFLSEIDQLSFAQQNILIELLAASTIKSNTSQSVHINKNIRLLASSSSSLSEMVANKEFSKQLYTELNFLTVTVPPIRERREDIPYILDNLLEKHRIFDDQYFSDEAKLALCDYHWPENYSEIERVVAQLLTLSRNTIIDVVDLHEFAPEVLIKTLGREREVHKNLISNLLNKNYEEFAIFHKGLQKALKYLAENYCNNVTLGGLAENAFVSESHLSYLFKFHLKRSFKQILVELRIEKAKSVLTRNPNYRITEVSLDAGFGDLSHFEKMFKRYTQVTPREYKNKIKLDS